MDRDRDREQERLVFVIRTTNIVETKMKRVIAAFINAPSERASFVDSYLLNNAAVPFGAKVKLILAISKALSVKVNRDAMHVLLSRRNAFAHQDHLSSIRVVGGANGYADVDFVVESIKASGELETVTQTLAFAEFVEAYAAVEADLDALLSALGHES